MRNCRSGGYAYPALGAQVDPVAYLHAQFPHQRGGISAGLRASGRDPDMRAVTPAG